jgi:hypothetical protein
MMLQRSNISRVFQPHNFMISPSLTPARLKSRASRAPEVVHEPAGESCGRTGGAPRLAEVPDQLPAPVKHSEAVAGLPACQQERL